MDSILGIDFSELVFEHSEHNWGYELLIVNTPLYCAKLIVLENKELSSAHYHKLKDETFIVLRGSVRFSSVDMELCRILNEGHRERILPGVLHQFGADEVPSVILEVSTHDRSDDTYRVWSGIDYGSIVREWLIRNGYKVDSGGWYVSKRAFSNILDSIGLYMNKEFGIDPNRIDFVKLGLALNNEGYVTTQVYRFSSK